MGYLRYLKVNDLKKEVDSWLVYYNKHFKTSFKVKDIYQIPKVKCEWDRIIAKVNDSENEKLISIRLFGVRGYCGFVLIDYSNDNVYEFSNRTVFAEFLLEEEYSINNYLENKYHCVEFTNELKMVVDNIKEGNIKKRIAKN